MDSQLFARYILHSRCNKFQEIYIYIYIFTCPFSLMCVQDAKKKQWSPPPSLIFLTNSMHRTRTHVLHTHTHAHTEDEDVNVYDFHEDIYHYNNVEFL